LLLFEEPPSADPHARWCGGCGQQWPRLPDFAAIVGVRDEPPRRAVHNSIANRAEAYNEFQQCMTTTKDTKSTKGSEDETLDAIF